MNIRIKDIYAQVYKTSFDFCLCMRYPFYYDMCSWRGCQKGREEHDICIAE